MEEPVVYWNGDFVPASQARLAFWDAGVVQGATLAEMTRTFRKQLFRLDDHLDRLFRGLRIAHINIGLSKEEFYELSLELLERNARLYDDRTELGLVHFVTAGEYGMYALHPPRREPTICAHTFPLPLTQWASAMKQGVSLLTPSIRQVPPQCWDANMKCRSRMHYFLAEQEVRRRDPTAMALLLNLADNVTETNSGNFLMVRDGQLVSPPTDYTLPGISWATILDLAEELGIPHAARDIPLAEALTADEAFLSGTSYCLLPVTKINDVRIGDGKPGSFHRRLLAAWSRYVGVDIERQIAAVAS